MNTKLSKLRLLTPLEKINNNVDVDKKKLKVVQENLNINHNFKTSVNYGFIEFSKTNGVKIVDVNCSPNEYDLSEFGKMLKFTFQEINLVIINIKNVIQTLVYLNLNVYKYFKFF